MITISLLRKTLVLKFYDLCFTHTKEYTTRYQNNFSVKRETLILINQLIYTSYNLMNLRCLIILYHILY